jgi:hypothetical protein
MLWAVPIDTDTDTDILISVSPDYGNITSLWAYAAGFIKFDLYTIVLNFQFIAHTEEDASFKE